MKRNKLMMRTSLASLCMITVLTGCDAKLKQEITLLQDQNRALQNQINQCEGALEDVTMDRDTLLARVKDANSFIDELNVKLAAKPKEVVIKQDVAEGWTPVTGGAMIAIEQDILFAPGKVNLKNRAKVELDSIVSTLQGEYSSKKVFVIGHTDNQPIKKSGWDDNYQLSSERALAVVRYLKERGVSASRLLAGACGEYSPRSSNSSASGRASNRRVEIFAMDSDILNN